jgi:hypothetical protein
MKLIKVKELPCGPGLQLRQGHRDCAERRLGIQPRGVSNLAGADRVGKSRCGVRFVFYGWPAAPGGLFLAHGSKSVPDLVIEHVYKPESHRHADVL